MFHKAFNNNPLPRQIAYLYNKESVGRKFILMEALTKP